MFAEWTPYQFTEHDAFFTASKYEVISLTMSPSFVSALASGELTTGIHPWLGNKAYYFLHLAQSLQDPVALLEGHLALGMLLWYLEELTEARAHLEQGIAFYDSQQHRSLAFRHGRAPGITSRYIAAEVLWLLGYPTGLAKEPRSHTLARELALL